MMRTEAIIFCGASEKINFMAINDEKWYNLWLKGNGKGKICE